MISQKIVRETSPAIIANRFIPHRFTRNSLRPKELKQPRKRKFLLLFTARDQTTAIMIIPIWLSCVKVESPEILVYTFLDTYSSNTFADQDVCKHINAIWPYLTRTPVSLRVGLACFRTLENSRPPFLQTGDGRATKRGIFFHISFLLYISGCFSHPHHINHQL